MVKAFVGPCLALLGAALALAGCSPAPIMERLPSELGGLPAGAPAPAHIPYRYPAVYDTPPPRATSPLTDEQQLKLEKQLQEARKKEENAAAGMGYPPAGK